MNLAPQTHSKTHLADGEPECGVGEARGTSCVWEGGVERGVSDGSHGACVEPHALLRQHHGLERREEQRILGLEHFQNSYRALCLSLSDLSVCLFVFLFVCLYICLSNLSTYNTHISTKTRHIVWLSSIGEDTAGFSEFVRMIRKYVSYFGFDAVLLVCADRFFIHALCPTWGCHCKICCYDHISIVSMFSSYFFCYSPYHSG